MFVSQRRIRVLVPTVGCNGQAQRAQILAESLRDAGMDVIQPGLGQTAEMIAATALREDVDVVSFSLDDTHEDLCQRVAALLRANSLADCLVVVCDSPLAVDEHSLPAQGISKAFPPGVPLNALVDYLQTNVGPPWALQ
jgi:methylmalonyl-CoA mutase C-terminal domain